MLSSFKFSLSTRRSPAVLAAWAGIGALVLLLGGCANPKLRAPVEERVVGASRPAADPTGTASSPTAAVASGIPVEPSAPARMPPGAENAGKPGYYTVKPGETLIRVGLETGQNWKDIAKWNNIDNINVIESGQVLRVVPPGADPAAMGARPVVATKVEPRPLEAKPSSPVVTPPAPAAAPAAVPAPAPAPAEPVAIATAPSGAAPAPPKEDENVNWMWPASGTVMSTFDEGKNKGVTLNGKLGDPVLASADGRVVYAGSGLRGYGNLVILKHNNTYLTAYAHNQALLVKEDQTVRRGQKIAEMGSTDADRVQLHFEIRKQGKPVDPLKLLPPR